MASWVKAVRTLIAAATSNAAGGTTRGTVDLRTASGGMLTIKITNGSTGPTAVAIANVLVAHNAGSTPSAASAGTDWKTITSFNCTTTNSQIHEFAVSIPDGVMHLEVEVTNNTGNAVLAESFLSEKSSFA